MLGHRDCNGPWALCDQRARARRDVSSHTANVSILRASASSDCLAACSSALTQAHAHVHVLATRLLVVGDQAAWRPGVPTWRSGCAASVPGRV